MSAHPNKFLYGALAFSPLILGILGTVPVVISVIEDPRSHEPPALAIIGICIWLLAVLMSIASLIVYIVHMARNRSLDDGARIGWIVGMIAGMLMCTSIAPMVLSIIYYFIYIARDQPNPPSGPNGPNEWDAKLNY